MRNIRQWVLLTSLLSCSAFALDFDSGATFTVRPELIASRSSIHGDMDLGRVIMNANKANGRTVVVGQTSTGSLNYGLGAIVFSPDWHRFSLGAGGHLIHSEVHFSGDYKYVPSMGDENTEVDFVNWNLDLELSAQWRPFSRHLFALNYRLSGITFGDQSAEWLQNGDKYLTEKANYRSLMNQFSLSYAYRILDRIEIGLEFDLNDPDYFQSEGASGNLPYNFGAGGGMEKRIRIAWPIKL